MSQKAELQKLLRERYDYFERMFEQGAIEALVNDFYTDDARIEGPGMPPQVGKAAICGAFTQARAAGFVRIKINVDALPEPAGELAYQFITNDNITSSGQVEVHRAIVVWRKTPDGWKCEVDLFYPKT